MRNHLCLAIIVSVAAWTAFITAGSAVPAAELRPDITDHTAPPYVDEATLPTALRGMYLPRGALEGLIEVFAADTGPVRSVRISWLSGDRYLWRLELAQPPAEGQSLTAYIDADSNPQTGRTDARGAEIMVQIGPGVQRVSEWMADGCMATARDLRGAIDGAVIWFSYDHPLGRGLGVPRCGLWVNTPAGNTDPIEVTVPGVGPRRLADDVLQVTTTPGPDGYLASALIEITNPGERERWIDLRVPFTLPFEGDFQWFDAFNFTPHAIGISPISYHGTSAMLPLTCAWDGRTGIALALNPMDLYTELHAGVRPSADGRELTLGTRLAIMPGETERFEVLAFGFDGALGWRGAFEEYWARFPQVYDRARDIDPRFHMASAGGLYRSWSDPTDERFASDLIRRMRGHWEWGYAPAPRPGEWAVTELSVGRWTRSRGTVPKSLSAEALPEVRARIRTWVHDTAQVADVAVAYYMHLKNVEKGLMEQYWSDSYFQNRPIEYLGYYQQTPCWYAYPWANSYGEYLQGAIPSIAESFSPAGMAFDSVFGFIPHWGPSADRSPATSFDNGLAFVAEGIGFAKQMDVVRRQHTNGYRTAMVTNLKLPTLSADAVRTDCALLEFHPMSNPAYRERVLRLRMLSGRIGFNWWNTYDPDLYRWIPWDRLNAQQTIDAFRRLRDDVLIHSLYYGAYPNARFTVGIPKLMRALPMLVEIADLGWQPVIGARPEASALLISRFGAGLGMGLGVGNQSYEAITDTVLIGREQTAAGQDVVLMAWDGAQTVTDFSADGPRLSTSVPPRDVRAYRAIMQMPAGVVSRASATADLHDYESSTLTVELECAAAAQPWVSLWVPRGAQLAEATLNDAHLVTLQVFDGIHRIPAAGPAARAQLDLQAGRNVLTVSWEPVIALQGDAQALLNFPFVANGAPNCNVVAYGNSRDLAFRVQEYFREYYRWATEEPQTIKLPLLTAEQATAGRRVVVGLIEELPPDLQIELGAALGAFGARGDVVYVAARTPAGLEQAVEGLLFTLDRKYEYWGPYFPTQNFFDGDPSKLPEALQAAGMAGRTLSGDDTGSLREVMELPDLIEWP